MRKQKTGVIFILAIAGLIFSCKVDELPVKRHNPGNMITNSVNMESNYKWQIYYDLKTNTVVGKNLKTIWDLGFECTEKGYHIIINSSKSMFAWKSADTVLQNQTDTNGFFKHRTWDEPSGSLDSTAIGNWMGAKAVYVLDRGYSETGAHMGYRKIQFVEVNKTKYLIKYCNLDGSNPNTIEILKDSLYNFVFLSLSTGTTVEVEPPKADWDLCFTQYTHVFYNPYETYLVTGCLLNRYQTQAVLDQTKTFEQISYSDVAGYIFSSHINAIGYRWKSYNGSVYATNPKMNYLIRDREGHYYKLHFIDFYNNLGNKGYPTWEYQKL